MGDLTNFLIGVGIMLAVGAVSRYVAKLAREKAAGKAEQSSEQGRILRQMKHNKKSRPKK